MEREELMARIDLAKSYRLNHEKAVQEISDLCMPFRGDIRTKKAPGQERILPSKGVFDSTGIIAQDAFVNFLKSTIFPSTLDWLRMSIGEESTPNSPANVAADKIARRIMRETHLSNFYNVVDSWIRDVAVLGTGTLFVEEKKRKANGAFGGLNFTAVPWGRVWFLTGKDGLPIFTVREAEIPLVAAYRKWGQNDDDKKPFPRHLMEMMKEQPMQLHKFMHVEWENEKGIPGGLQSPEKKPYVSHWVCESDDGLAVLDTRGSDLKQYITARWMVVDGEDHGRGQGHIARPDLKGVNKLKELTLDAAGVDLKPPFLVEDETAINLDLGPSGLVVVRAGQKTNPQFLPTGSRYDVADAIGRQDREAIRKAFLMDMIDDPEFQDRSAAAVRDRQSKAAQRLAPRADKVYTEMLYPLVAVIANRMAEADALPELEQIQDEFEGMEVAFVSPFFTAQKEAPAIRLAAWLEDLKRNAVEMQRPDMLDYVDLDKYVKVMASMSDVPAEVIREDRVVREIRQARTEAAQRQQALDQAEQLTRVRESQDGQPAI